MMIEEQEHPFNPNGYEWPKRIDKRPVWLKGAYFDSRRQKLFVITEARKHVTGQIVLDLEAADGSFQQFTADFFQCLLENNELSRPASWN